MNRILLPLLSLLATIGMAQGALVRGPYLQALGHESVVVRWRTSSPSPGTVRYGTNPTNLNLHVSSPADASDHEIAITNLTSETAYYYQIEDTVVLAGGGDHYWKTYPTPGAIRPMRIWAIGDPGTATANQWAVRDAYINFNNASGTQIVPGVGHTDALLMLGDIAYNDGTDNQFQAAVFDGYPTLLRNSGTYVTRGNHERNVDVYYDNLTMPMAGESGGFPSGTEAYYSFDHGHVHFICLDSYGTDRSAGSPMWTWLENDLASTTAEFIIAFFHHPPYTKGSHNSDVEGDLIDMRTRALPLLDQYGVDLCLTGHSHSYERSLQIAGHYGTSPTFDPLTMLVNGGNGNLLSDGAYQNGNGDTGVVYIVAGSSGKVSSSIPSQANWHPVMHEMLRELGSVVIDVDGGRMDVGFLNSVGDFRDTFTILHPEIEFPLVLDGTPYPYWNGADLRADLVATGAFTTVQVFWAASDVGTDPAAWSNRADLGVQTEGDIVHTVFGLLPDRDYVYRVRAANADGESWTGPMAFHTPLRLPVIRLDGVTNVTYQSADVGFELLNEGEGPASVTLYYGLTDPGETNVGWDAGLALGPQDRGASFATSLTGLPSETTYVYRYRVVNAFGEAWTLGGQFTTRSRVPEIEHAAIPGAAESEILVSGGSVWTYLDDGSEQGTAWKDLGFDDAAWASGPAELGYGDNDEATVVSYGGKQKQKHITTYFRHAFQIADPGEYSSLQVQLVRDDGAVVYLNGIEVLRSNMPGGNIDSETPALGSSEGNQVYTYPIGNHLVPGENVVAVSVHQRAPDSSDISFDYSMTAERTLPQDAFNITVTSADVRADLINLGEGPTGVTVYYGRSDGGATPDSWEHSLDLGSQAEGFVIASLTNLAFESDYFYRFYAENTVGSDWAGTTGVFRVLDAFPEITQNTAASVVNYTSAILAGTLVDDAAFPTTVHLYYGTTDGDTDTSAWQSSVDLGVQSEGSVGKYLLNLTHNTTYFFRLYAGNENGGEWSQASGTFTTRDGTPEIVNTAPSEVEFQTARANGELLVDASAANTVKVYMGPVDGGTNPANWPMVFDVGSHTAGPLGHLWTGLTPSTTYVYRFYTENVYASDWADSATSFTTTSGAPSIQNAVPAVSGLVFDQATVHGDLSYEGLAPTTVSLLWGTSDGGAEASNWQQTINLGVASQGPVSQTLTGLEPFTTYSFRYAASNPGGADMAPQTSSFTTPAAVPEVSVALPQSIGLTTNEAVALPALCAWHFHDEGSEPGGQWSGAEFDHHAWPMGWARLGYGVGNEGTVLDYGGDPANKFITTYFRCSFLVDEPDAFDMGQLRLAAGDGAVVYVNGVPVTSMNLPANPTHSTLALAEREPTPHMAGVAPSLLHAGTNQVAVEVHQASAAGTDICFDLQLDLQQIVPAYQFPGVASATFTSASLNYSLLDDGGAPTALSLHFGPADAGPGTAGWAASVSLGDTSLGNHAVTLTGLQPGTRYYYRLRAVNADEEDWTDGPAFFDTVSATADEDGDGMPDLWEVQHFGDTSALASGDADLDGSDNRAEYLAGTNPKSSASRLTLFGVHGNSAHAAIAFASRAGQPYLLEFCPALTDGVWEPKRLLFGTGSRVEYPPLTSDIQGFYRLQLLGK